MKEKQKHNHNHSYQASINRVEVPGCLSSLFFVLKFALFGSTWDMKAHTVLSKIQLTSNHKCFSSYHTIAHLLKRHPSGGRATPLGFPTSVFCSSAGGLLRAPSRAEFPELLAEQEAEREVWMHPAQLCHQVLEL